MFATLLVWRIAAGSRQPGQRLLLAAFALTACWAWLAAIAPGDPLVAYAETARNLVWIAMLYFLSATPDARQTGVRLVYGAVGAVLGLQLVADTIALMVGTGAATDTAIILRVTAAAGALVLVHNVYGQASPASRPSIRFAMLALAIMWIYDLNLYTIAYLNQATSASVVLRISGPSSDISAMPPALSVIGP